MKTLETIHAQKTHLAAVDRESIETSSVHELRTVARDLGLTHIDRLGEPVPIRNARKAELVTLLTEVAATERVLSRAVIPADPDEVCCVDIPTAQFLYDSLVPMAQLTRTNSNLAISKLAHKVVMAVALAYPDTSEKLRFNTRCGVRSRLLRDLRCLTSAENSVVDDELWQALQKSVNSFADKDHVLKRAVNDEKTNHRADNPDLVYLDGLLAWSQQKLTTLPQDPTRWREVVCALALVSGRRMNELLCDATNFVVDGEFSIQATGLSKGKDGDLPSIDKITTLCEPSLVLAGIDWLREHGKFVSVAEEGDVLLARERVNKRFGKELSMFVKSLYQSHEVFPAELDSSKKPSFHSLRKFYVLLVLRNLDGTLRSLGKEAARLLGHSDTKTTNDNYKSEFYIINPCNL